MNNIKIWCKNSNKFAQENPELVENPQKDMDINYDEEVDL